MSDHEDLVRVYEGVKYGVKEEVGDRTEGEEACYEVCVEPSSSVRDAHDGPLFFTFLQFEAFWADVLPF